MLLDQLVNAPTASVTRGALRREEREGRDEVWRLHDGRREGQRVVRAESHFGWDGGAAVPLPLAPVGLSPIFLPGVVPPAVLARSCDTLLSGGGTAADAAEKHACHGALVVAALERDDVAVSDSERDAVGVAGGDGVDEAADEFELLAGCCVCPVAPALMALELVVGDLADAVPSQRRRSSSVAGLRIPNRPAGRSGSPSSRRPEGRSPKIVTSLMCSCLLG